MHEIFSNRNVIKAMRSAQHRRTAARPEQRRRNHSEIQAHTCIDINVSVVKITCVSVEISYFSVNVMCHVSNAEVVT